MSNRKSKSGIGKWIAVGALAGLTGVYGLVKYAGNRSLEVWDAHMQGQSVTGTPQNVDYPDTLDDNFPQMVPEEWVDTNSSKRVSELERKATNNVPRTNSVPSKPGRTALAYDDVDSHKLASYLIPIESSGNPKAISKSGARGLLQIMPETWKEITREIYGRQIPFSHAFDPHTNKTVAIAYLEKIEDMLSKNIPYWNDLSLDEKQDRIAAGYNGGPNRLIRNKGNIGKMPKETRNYVQKLRDIRG